MGTRACAALTRNPRCDRRAHAAARERWGYDAHVPPILPSLDYARGRTRAGGHARYARSRLPVLVCQILASVWLGLAPPGPSAAYGDEAAPARPAFGEHLDVEAERTRHDFGFAAQEDVLETKIVLRNSSAARIEGLVAVGECGCNEVFLESTSLEAGGTTTLRIVFHTLALHGRLEKTIRVRTAAAERGELRIVQTIAILEGIVVEPKTISFRNVRRGEMPSATVRMKWFEGHGRPFRIVDARVPGHPLTVAARPWSDAADPTARGWELTFAFAEPAHEGQLSAEAIVKTDHPDFPRFALPLSAHVSGPVWLQARTMHFGSRPTGAVRKSTIRFRPFDASVVFGEVKASSRTPRVTVVVEPDPVHGEKGWWALSAILPADAPVGSLADEAITLDVGLAGEAPIVIPVQGHVRAAVAKPNGS